MTAWDCSKDPSLSSIPSTIKRISLSSNRIRPEGMLSDWSIWRRRWRVPGHHKQDEKLIVAAKKIWENIVQKRMYVTGGIGSTVRGEAFTYDYDLPNDLMYCETCAAIGLLNFSNELLKSETDSRYADIMERTLYNGIISGMALDGKHFFYVNPLEVDPQASALNPDKSHVKATRPSWFGCACCPPNLARTLPAVGRYAFTQKTDEVLLNLFIDSELAAEQDGKPYTIRQSHTFSEKGRTLITVEKASSGMLRLGIRIPYWASRIHCWLWTAKK